MSKQAASRKAPMSEINVVPYIDVMLVLLVIFMITAPLLKTGVEIDLPDAAAKPLDADQKDPIILTVNQEGLLFLNIGDDPDQSLSAEAVMIKVSAILKNRPGAPVLVAGDTGVDYGAVIRGMTILQTAGVKQVGLMTESGQ
ncbi:MAG: protein TolR [Gammaproteobacteria bacterium]|nr:protein TolR [Gammaproteobacteria bacterium]